MGAETAYRHKYCTKLGLLPEWLGGRLQPCLHRFESDRVLQFYLDSLGDNLNGECAGKQLVYRLRTQDHSGAVFSGSTIHFMRA